MQNLDRIASLKARYRDEPRPRRGKSSEAGKARTIALRASRAVKYSTPTK